MEQRRAVLVGLVFLLCVAAGGHGPRSSGPKSRGSQGAVANGAATLKAIQAQRITRLTTFVNAAHTFASTAHPARIVDASELQMPMTKSHAISILRGNAAPSPSPRPANAAGGHRNLDNLKNGNSDTSASVDAGSGSSPTFNSADGAVQIIAAKPINEAVSHICGAAATVCGVWWPTALGNQQQYESCMSQHVTQSDLEFGESANEYCSALWAGDCESVSPQSSLGELCSLVNGNGVQWETRYDFGDFVTWGDCDNYTTVDQPANNVIGIKLKDVPHLTKPAPQASPTPADLKVCAGRLYLLGAP